MKDHLRYVKVADLHDARSEKQGADPAAEEQLDGGIAPARQRVIETADRPRQGEARAIGEMLPLTHFVRAARSVLLKRQDAAGVAQEMWPVAVFGLTAAALALAAYRRRLD